MDVLLPRVDLQQELHEELEASPEPHQRLGGRVPNLRRGRLELMQHYGLECGEALGV